MNLSNTLLFRGLEDTEITSLLNCLDATERSYKKSEVILSEGSITENIGIVRLIHWSAAVQSSGK